MNEKKTITYTLQNWHFVVFIIIANLICVAVIIATNEQENGDPVPFPHPVLVIQLLVVGVLITAQIIHGLGSFKKCRNCGHSKHQHDKARLVKRGFYSICPIICDNYEQVAKGESVKENYVSKYKDGYTT